MAKEANRFPGFDDALISDLRVSLDLFLDAVTWSQASDYRQLLQSDTLYFNGRLAKIYGAMLPEDAPFQPVTLAGQPRAGVLTHPLLMAGFAYSATTSPIHRGVFVSRNLLGRRLRSPRWSPDGARIAFLSDRDGGRGIRVVPAAGGRALRCIHRRVCAARTGVVARRASHRIHRGRSLARLRPGRRQNC